MGKEKNEVPTWLIALEPIIFAVVVSASAALGTAMGIMNGLNGQ